MDSVNNDTTTPETVEEIVPSISEEGSPVSSEGTVNTTEVDEPNLDSMSKMVSDEATTTTTTPSESIIPTESVISSQSKKGVVLSVKQRGVIEKRNEIFSRMKKSFEEKFGTDKSAKPTMTNAAHIMRRMNEAEKRARQGAEAAGAGPEETAEAGQEAREGEYDIAISEVMTGYNGTGKRMTKKAVPSYSKNSYTQKAANNSYLVNRPAVSQNIKVNSSQVNSLITSFDTMVNTAKGIIDTMGNMSKNLVRQLGKTENIAGLQQTVTAANNALSGSKSMMRNMNNLSQPLEPLGTSNTASVINNFGTRRSNVSAFGNTSASALGNNLSSFGKNVSTRGNNTLFPMAASKSKQSRTKRGKNSSVSRKTKKRSKKPVNTKYTPYVTNETNGLPSLTSIVEEGPNNLQNNATPPPP
jgi:hypothetical protein